MSLSILGSTGSIGTQTLDVVRFHQDRFDVVALAAGHDSPLLRAQSDEFEPSLVVSGTDSSGLVEAATHPDSDIVVMATSGHAGIAAALAAAKEGKIVALANKETVVCAGAILFSLAREHNAHIRPVDSEHSAIWQAIGPSSSDVERVILTASGGPFIDLTSSEIGNVTVDQALSHPTWDMGGKITIDSATMMNKALELIEAHWLFDIDFDQIDVLIHRQSIVHSLVAFRDGSQRAQLGWPDMRQPIQFALTYPEHAPSPCTSLNLADVGTLTFESVEPQQFPAISLAYAAGRAGGSVPTVMSAADDIAVEAFLSGQIRFVDIVPAVQATLDLHDRQDINSLDDVLEVDSWARSSAGQTVKSITR